MVKNPIPLATVEKILKENGAERVSDNAKKRLAEVLKEYADNLSREILQFSKHAGRKTIKEEDVMAASKRGVQNVK